MHGIFKNVQDQGMARLVALMLLNSHPLTLEVFQLFVPYQVKDG